MESITGTIEGVRYHKVSNFSEAGNKWLIANFTYEQENKYLSTCIRGEMNKPVHGWKYRLFGEWRDDPTYGLGFNFSSFEPILDKSFEGMADYLRRSVPEIGVKRARLIVDHFGNDSFSILKTNPERLSEVDGIPAHAFAAVQEFFLNDNAADIDPEAYARLYDLLSPIRPPQHIIKSLLRSFGSNAPQFITENPYRLLDYPGMGWIRVDRLATQVLKYDKNGIFRHEQAINEVLARNSEYGHTKIDDPTLHVDSYELLELSLREDAIGSMVDQKLIINEDKFISSEKLFRAEREIAYHLSRLQVNTSPLGFSLDSPELEDKQALIPEMVENNSVSILSGIPGSGKTHSVSIIIRKFVENGISDILVVAPTGKAAKRNSEFLQDTLHTSIPCMTIHRALAGRLESQAETGIPEDQARLNRGRDKFIFQHNENNPLPFSVFIIDESSMLDVEVAAAFLKAIPDGSRLLIVGDHYQLPSVGPGSFLRDLMTDIPSVILDKPRRNSGTIAHSCYLIKDGKNPNPALMLRDDPASNWTHIEIKDELRILEFICQTHRNYIDRHDFTAAKLNLQVISPEKKGILGCNNLNKILGQIVNPGEEIKESKNDEDIVQVREGDKIVRLKNGPAKSLITESQLETEEWDQDEPQTVIFDDTKYTIGQTYLVNGDMGEVVGFKNSYVIVKFINPDRFCMLPKSDAKIALAYAMTVHKMQGSSAPIVIMPLWDYYWNPRANTGIWCRELVYTALSRPSERLITVGKLSELHAAISRVTINQRKTRLASMIKNHQIGIST